MFAILLSGTIRAILFHLGYRFRTKANAFPMMCFIVTPGKWMNNNLLWARLERVISSYNVFYCVSEHCFTAWEEKLILGNKKYRNLLYTVLLWLFNHLFGGGSGLAGEEMQQFLQWVKHKLEGKFELIICQIMWLFFLLILFNYISVYYKLIGNKIIQKTLDMNFTRHDISEHRFESANNAKKINCSKVSLSKREKFKFVDLVWWEITLIISVMRTQTTTL